MSIHGARGGAQLPPRMRRLEPNGDVGAALVGTLVDDALLALPKMYRPASREFVHTTRRDRNAPGRLRPEGTSARYSAIVGLGAARLEEARQRELLAGITASELVESVATRAVNDRDVGAVALAAWAAAELGTGPLGELYDRLDALPPLPARRFTVVHSWSLSAMVAGLAHADVMRSATRLAEELLAAQEPSGLFPHVLAREALPAYRAHVGCFADQVYPLQALARYAAATGDRRALDAADRCASAVVRRQGPAGQWWWHYDVRTGEVVEKYPVYSVHQHAMAPMALLDLHDAGGADHLKAVVAGLGWLCSHSEVQGELLDGGSGAVWRKVGRREPRKAVRSARALATAIAPRAKLAVLDQLCPPTLIDYECRPYELGWLLYAWQSGRAAGSAPSAPAPAGREGV